MFPRPQQTCPNQGRRIRNMILLTQINVPAGFENHDEEIDRKLRAVVRCTPPSFVATLLPVRHLCVRCDFVSHGFRNHAIPSCNAAAPRPR